MIGIQSREDYGASKNQWEAPGKKIHLLMPRCWMTTSFHRFVLLLYCACCWQSQALWWVGHSTPELILIYHGMSEYTALHHAGETTYLQVIQMISCRLLISRYKLSWLQCHNTSWQWALQRIPHWSRGSSELLCGISSVFRPVAQQLCNHSKVSAAVIVMENSNVKNWVLFPTWESQSNTREFM